MAGLADIFKLLAPQSLQQWQDANAEKIARNQGAFHAPTLRDRISTGIEEGLKWTGTPAHQARGVAQPLTEVVENVTPAGLFTAAQDAQEEAGKGNYMAASLAGLGAVPGVGPETRALAKEAGLAETLTNAVAAPAVKTMYHPVSDIKLKQPLEEMRAGYVDTHPLIEKKTLDPEQLYREGAVIMPAPGDRSIAGKSLVSINGEPLDRAVTLEGGPNFMRGPQQQAEGAAWASARPVISGMAKRAQGLEKNGPVYLNYMPMAHGGVDYSTMMADAIVQRLKNAPITDETTALFDEAMRSQYGKFKPYENFPGLRQLINTEGAGWIPEAGKARTKLAKLADTDRFQQLGFPDVGSIRHALTEPELLNTPSLTSGYGFARLDPGGRVITEPALPHGTYNTQLGGTYVGGLPQEVPLEVMYPDFAASLPEGLPTSRRDYKFRLEQPVQVANQQWLDNISRYLEGAHR